MTPSTAADPLEKLWCGIVDNTTDQSFWIAEILLHEITKETGYCGPGRPSTPASTDAGALADVIETLSEARRHLVSNRVLEADKAIARALAALRNSAPQETPSSPASPAALRNAPAPAVVPQGPGGAGEASPQETRGDEPVVVPDRSQIENLVREAFNEGAEENEYGWKYSRAKAALDVLAAPQQSPRLERDKLLIDQRLTVFAENAAKRIARAEQLDNVSAKEIYRTIIEAMVSGCIALQTAQDADALLSPDTTVVSSTERADG